MKAIKWIVIIVLIIVVAGALLLGPALNKLVKMGVEEIGPRATKTTVSVESVDISPWSGEGVIKGLVVGNPEGFKQPTSFELGMIKVALDTSTLTSNVIVINEIAIDGAKLTCEQEGGKNNLSSIQTNVNAFTEASEAAEPAKGEAGQEPAAAEKPAAKEGKTGIVIKRFAFTNGGALLSGFNIKKEIELKEIVLTDIGNKSKPKTIAEAIMQIMKEINRDVFEAIAKEGVNVKELMSSVKAADITEKVNTDKVMEALPEKTQEEGKKLLDKAKKLIPFGK